jgi:hypothetical protein
MLGPPPAGAGQTIRRSPANGEALLHARYDLRAADGLRLCSVSREMAAAQIAAGSVVLVQGRAGAYLRPAAPGPLPESRTHHGGRRTWHGPIEPGQGAPARYGHAPGARAWPQPRATVEPLAVEGVEGQSFLRYPQPSELTCGPKFPTLAKRGLK